jgi:hypothetical protein
MMGFWQGDQVGYLTGVAGYTVYIMAENESQHAAFDMSEGQLNNTYYYPHFSHWSSRFPVFGTLLL